MTLSRYGTIIGDQARWNRGTELLSAALAFARYQSAIGRPAGDRLTALLNIARKSPPRLLLKFIADEVTRMRPALGSWSKARTGTGTREATIHLPSTTMLKMSAPSEKGVLFVATEGDLVVLLRHPRLPRSRRTT